MQELLGPELVTGAQKVAIAASWITSGVGFKYLWDYISRRDDRRQSELEKACNAFREISENLRKQLLDSFEEHRKREQELTADRDKYRKQVHDLRNRLQAYMLNEVAEMERGLNDDHGGRK